MCRSLAEGGQRCSAHTRPAFEAATFGTPEWDEAAAQHASTKGGHADLTDLAGRAEDAGNIEMLVAAECAIDAGARLRAVSKQTAEQVAAGRTEWEAAVTDSTAGVVRQSFAPNASAVELHFAPGSETSDFVEEMYVFDHAGNEIDLGDSYGNAVSRVEDILGRNPKPADAHMRLDFPKPADRVPEDIAAEARWEREHA